MKTKIEIKDIFGNVLFEHKQENNTLKISKKLKKKYMKD